jgi:hypothetical protein
LSLVSVSALATRYAVQWQISGFKNKSRCINRNAFYSSPYSPWNNFQVPFK